MKKKKLLNRPFTTFVILCYLIFFIFFIAIGLAMLIGLPESITSMLQIISAWSSTIAFIFIFNQIYPNLTLKRFIKKQFSTRIRFSVLSTIIIIQMIIVALTIFLVPHTNDTQTFSLSFTSVGFLIIAFFDNLVRGPLGEELGWRGFALNELQKKYSPLKSSLIIGVLWGFWHTPLWFASGYTGVNLIKYMVFFMIGILSFSIIITFFYNLNKNLVIPIIAHQLFNFSLVIIQGDLLDILVYVMLFYCGVASLIIVINPYKVLYNG